VQLIGPTDAIVISRDSIVLQWKRSAPEITAYQIEVKLDTTTLVVESLITDTTLALRMLKPLDWHTWRVRAKNVSGWSAWSSRWKFRYLPVPTTVELALPADGAKIHLDSLRLTWVAARSEVTAYQLEIMNNGEAVYSDTTLVTLTKAVVGLQKESSYTWRVRAKNQSGWGEWSAVRNVTLYKQDPTSVINEYVWKDLTIDPQPASELIEIAGIDPETPSIRVYNAAGSVVFERMFVNPASTLTLDVSQLPAGVYLVVAGRSKSFVIVQ